jgi:hypothetical protein
VPIFPAFVLDTALLGWCLLGALRRWRTCDLVPLAVMGLWLVLGSWHLRAVSDAALLTSPFLAVWVSSAWRQA